MLDKDMMLVLVSLRSIVGCVLMENDRYMVDVLGYKEGEVEEMIKKVNSYCKKKFLNEVFKEDVKVVDIMEYIDFVEESSGWDCDYEIEGFREWIENNK